MNSPILNKRNIHGILLLDKPINYSSNAILQKIKRIYRAKKAGHTGSLDPLASGLLPICFGEATKFSQFLLDSDKTYRVAALLGIRTTTGDKEGESMDMRSVPAFSLQDIDKACNAFRGEIEQIPSMYSALKHEGKPLYQLAREGITIERAKRPVTIYELMLTKFENNIIEFDLHCSKGTYVRTLVDDLGEILGCGAHVIALRRLKAGPYISEAMVTVDELELLQDNLSELDQKLLPISTSIATLPEVELTESMAFYLRQGQSIMLSKAPSSGLVRISTKSGQFIGVGEMMEGQRLTPRRLVRIQ